MQDIMDAFNTLDAKSKNVCMSKLLEVINKETPLKEDVQRISKLYPYNNMKTINNLKLEEYIQAFNPFLIDTILSFTGKALKNITSCRVHPV